MNPAKLQIAVCSCQRPAMLKECLNSILRAQLPDGYEVSVAVIDNDSEQSAKATVEELAANAPIPIDYVPEPRRGIPVARNKAMDHAAESHIDYMVFVDDDEQVADDWLLVLTAYAEEKGGQAVIHGYVVCTCPDDAPEYLKPFYIKKKQPTGTSLDTCPTDNVLFPLHPILQHKLRFDESQPLAGGTDTLFFSAAHRLGIQIYSCADALAYETVPHSRISIRWLSRRRYRVAIGKVRRGLYADMDQAKLRRQSTIRCIRKTMSALLYLILGNGNEPSKPG